MLKTVKSILFVIGIVMVFTAQGFRTDAKDQKREGSPLPVHNNPIRQQEPSHREAPRQEASRQETPKREASRQEIQRQAPVEQTRQYQFPHQERGGPRVYAVAPSETVENNRFLNRRHHNHWQPRYNFYDNQYHFYPYVNIAALVDLSGGYVVVGPDGQNYYYDQGTFYLQDPSGQYEAVAPPLGIIVNPLASGARQIMVDGQIFYRYKGVFYQQVAQGFQVIGPVQSDSGA